MAKSLSWTNQLSLKKNEDGGGPHDVTRRDDGRFMMTFSSGGLHCALVRDRLLSYNLKRILQLDEGQCG